MDTSRSFYMKKVYSFKGKKLGVIKDIILDLKNKSVLGFKVSDYTMFKKKDFLDVRDIKFVCEEKIIGVLSTGDGIRFSEYKHTDILDYFGVLKGALEDIIIDMKTYKIKGIIISPGILEKLSKGKEILLSNNIEFKKDCILDLSSNNITFKNITHKAMNYEFFKKA